MSEDELRERAWPTVAAGEVAEEFVQVVSRAGLVELVRTAGEFAAAWLADHPADDGEVVTAEWLKAAGFEFTEAGQFTAEKAVGYDSHVVGVSTTNLKGWYVYDSFDDGNMVSVGGMSTRGHVRRLCAALGVKLKESQP